VSLSLPNPTNRALQDATLTVTAPPNLQNLPRHTILSLPAHACYHLG